MAPELEGIELGGLGDEAAPALGDQLAVHEELGWTALELRTIDGRQLAAIAEGEVRAAAARIADAGLRTVAVASRIGGWGRSTATPLEEDVRELELLAPRMEALDTRWVRVMSWEREGIGAASWRREAIDRMRVLARRAEALGVVLLHENCAGWAGQGPDETLELLAEVDSPALRLLLDLGNGPAYGYDALPFLERVLEHVDHVHVKDAVTTGGEPAYVQPGEGECGILECLRALVAADWKGTWVVEPHLHLAPHAGAIVAPGAAREAFVAYGRALEALIERELIPSLEAGRCG